MKKSYIDLHMHTMYSDDGQYSPTELVKMCYESGIKIMSIADHNTVLAIDEAVKCANSLQITCIPAIEIDCSYKGINLHVVGYGIDYKSLVFNELGKNIERQELSCSSKKIELTNALGFELKKEELDKLSTNGVYTGEMFAEVLLKDPRYLSSELLMPYRNGGPRGDNPYVNFYWDYYSQGKACYTEVKFPSLEDVVSLINDNGGIAVLAHPGNNLKGNYDIVDELIRVGIQGIECFSSYHDDETNVFFYNKAKEKNLLITCGSDFHGKTKPSIVLGENGCLDCDEIVLMLKQYKLV